MDTKRTLTLLATTVLTLLVTALPVLATEAAPEGKSQLIMRSPHHVVGTFILMAGVLFLVLAIGNAVRQLRGERDQADGKFRWR